MGMTSIVEDIPFNIGMDIMIGVIMGRSDEIASVTVSGFPEGSSVVYTDLDGNPFSTMAGMSGLSVTIPGNNEGDIRAVLETLFVTAPPRSGWKRIQ